MKITIEQEVYAPLNEVWKAWVTSADIVCWNFATDDWCCPAADISLEVGGHFSYRMEAKDGSMGFDYSGEFMAVNPEKRIQYKLEDSREVVIEFVETENGIQVIETFDADDGYSVEQQKQGWLGILGNFKKYVETKKCDKCSVLNTEIRVNSPKQLSNLIRTIKLAISEGILLEVSLKDDLSSVSFDQVDVEGYWQDIIYNQFICKQCNNKFKLFADTYHGSNRNGWYLKGR